MKKIVRYLSFLLVLIVTLNTNTYANIKDKLKQIEKEHGVVFLNTLLDTISMDSYRETDLITTCTYPTRFEIHGEFKIVPVNKVFSGEVYNKNNSYIHFTIEADYNRIELVLPPKESKKFEIILNTTQLKILKRFTTKCHCNNTWTCDAFKELVNEKIEVYWDDIPDSFNDKNIVLKAISRKL